jgi:TPR repeat protein
MFGRSGLDAGVSAFHKKKWKRARTLLEDPAVKGERLACYHFGMLLWRGLGGPMDREGAVYWFRRAADDGLPAAQDALGVALRVGGGISKDSNAARTLFATAAERGYAPAMVNLATMSEFHEARALMVRAAEAGHTPAMLHVSDMIERAEPTEALAWLYAAVALTGNQGTAKRAKALARELAARDIAAAQARGRALVKRVQQTARENRA